MRRIITEKKGRREMACILAISLCLTGSFNGVGRKGSESTALASAQLSEDTVWNYDETTSGKAAITGYQGTDAEIQIPETIQSSNGRSLAVTKIKDYAFDGCTGLTGVAIPGSVTDIGEGILRGCSNIREITVAEERMRIMTAGRHVMPLLQKVPTNWWRAARRAGFLRMLK